VRCAEPVFALLVRAGDEAAIYVLRVKSLLRALPLRSERERNLKNDSICCFLALGGRSYFMGSGTGGKIKGSAAQQINFAVSILYAG
jgi:hypothetical protein